MIHIAIIGCGRIVSEGHVHGIRQLGSRCKVVALADVAGPNLKLVGHLLQVPRSGWYADHRELLRRERGKVDVVVLALPHKLHKPILIDTARAGYAILTEKPLTVDLAEARDVFRVLRKHKTRFGIVHNYWRAPHMLSIVKAVRDGKIGRPFLYRTEGIGGSYWPGAKTYRSKWRSESKLGGRGCLLDNGYHQVYSAERIVGSPIISAFARIETYNRDYTVEDTAAALLRHKNGATTSLLVGWSVSGGGQGVFEVHGTLGSISQTRKEIEGTAFYSNKTAKWTVLELVKPKYNAYGGIYADFIAALRSGKPYVDNYAAAWNNMAILEACYRSAASKREERVERW